jgi:hypothetical protein
MIANPCRMPAVGAEEPLVVEPPQSFADFVEATNFADWAAPPVRDTREPGEGRSWLPAAAAPI